MQGLIMDFELTVPVMLRRAEQLFGPREIVTRLPDKSLHRYTYGDFIPRARRLGAALTEHGGDKLLIVDESLLPLAQSFLGETDIEHVIVIGEAPEGMLSYEELLAG